MSIISKAVKSDFKQILLIFGAIDPGYNASEMLLILQTPAAI